MSDESFNFCWHGKSEAITLIDQRLETSLVSTQGETKPQLNTPNHRSHIFIKGDNLLALKNLRLELSGQIKMIYIDPPYNTGQNFIYSDRYSMKPSPDNESLSTQDRSHAKWLSMMYPRLAVAKHLLTEDGVIYVSIDDNEYHHLRLIMDEIFGAKNFIATLVWETKRAARGRPPRSLLMTNHEYILCYGKCSEKVRFRGLDRTQDDFTNPDHDPRGLWRSESMKATGQRDNYFGITDPSTGNHYKGNWAFSKTRLAEMIKDNLVIFPKKKSGTPRQKKFYHSYLNQTKAGVSMLGWHSTEKATRALRNAFDGKKIFPFPKPQSLLLYLIDQTVGPKDIVLDFFAGSGSTGEAVLSDNIQHQRQSRFILVQAPFPIDPMRSENRDAISLCHEYNRPTDLAELCHIRLNQVISLYPEAQLKVLELKAIKG